MTIVHQVATHRSAFLLLFAGVVAAVYATALTLARQLPHLEGASAVVVGLTADMVVVVPLAFYLLVIRRRGLSIVSLVPVILLSLLAASRVLPAAHQQPLRVLEAVAIPMELGLIGWIVWRAVRAVRKAHREVAADPLEQLRSAAFGLTRNDRAAGVFASEIGIFYYALGSWRARPHVPAASSAFTHHRRSGQAGIVFTFLFLLAVEGCAVHYFLLGWSALAAWIFTIGTIYGALWLIADYRATVLRPVLVNEKSIMIRCGLRWTMNIPRARIIAIGRERPKAGKESLNLMLLGAPTHWITLSEPLLAHGMYGTLRRVLTIGLAPDEAEAFERALLSDPD